MLNGGTLDIYDLGGCKEDFFFLRRKKFKMNIGRAGKAPWISNGSIGKKSQWYKSKWIKTIWAKFSWKYTVWKIKEEKCLAKMCFRFYQTQNIWRIICRGWRTLHTGKLARSCTLKNNRKASQRPCSPLILHFTLRSLEAVAIALRGSEQ